MEPVTFRTEASSEVSLEIPRVAETQLTDINNDAAPTRSFNTFEVTVDTSSAGLGLCIVGGKDSPVIAKEGIRPTPLFLALVCYLFTLINSTHHTIPTPPSHPTSRISIWLMTFYFLLYPDFDLFSSRWVRSES